MKPGGSGAVQQERGRQAWGLRGCTTCEEGKSGGSGDAQQERRHDLGERGCTT